MKGRCLLLGLAALFFFPTVHAAFPLAGLFFNISAKTGAPFIFSDNINGSPVVSGYCVDLLEAVANRLGFTYSITVIGSSVSVSQMIASNNDPAVGFNMSAGPLTITSERIKTADFTMPFYYLGLRMAVAASRVSVADTTIVPSNFFRFLTPLTPELWAFTAVLAIMIGLFWAYFEQYEKDYHPGTAIQKVGIGLYKSLMTNVLGRNMVKSDRVWTQIVNTFIFLTFFAFVAFYTSTLIAYIIVQPDEVYPIKDLDLNGLIDIRDLSPILNELVVNADSSISAYIDTVYGPNAKNLYRTCVSSDDCIRMVINGLATVFIYDQPVLEYKAAANIPIPGLRMQESLSTIRVMVWLLPIIALTRIYFRRHCLS